jgi:hypothetical protein
MSFPIAQPPSPTGLEAEIARLTANDAPREAERCARIVRQNVRHWEERRREDPKATEWALLDAYLARVDCDDDFSTPIHAERMAFVREVFQRLLGRDGLPYALAHPHRRHLVSRLNPQALV